MTRQKNTPAAATAQGKTNELQNYYNNTVDGLQAKIPNKLSSVALQIENGVTMLEVAAEAYEVLSDAVESEFNYVPDNPTEEVFLNRLNMYFSAFSLFQKELQDALGELQVGKDELLSIKKAGADHD